MRSVNTNLFNVVMLVEGQERKVRFLAQQALKQQELVTKQTEQAAKQAAEELKLTNEKLMTQQHSQNMEIKALTQRIEECKQEHARLQVDALKKLSAEHQIETAALKQTIATLQDQLAQVSEQLEHAQKSKQTSVMSLAHAHLDQVTQCSFSAHMHRSNLRICGTCADQHKVLTSSLLFARHGRRDSNV